MRSPVKCQSVSLSVAKRRNDAVQAQVDQLVGPAQILAENLVVITRKSVTHDFVCEVVL